MTNNSYLKKMQKWSFLILAAMAFQCFFCSAVFAELTEETFRKDLSFYYKTSKSKNLSANDRLYILNKLREKYREVELDLTDLYAEIDRQSTAKQKGSSEPEKVELQKKEISRHKTETFSKLTKILVTENNKFSKVQLDVANLNQYKDILLKDETKTQPPVIALYLYHTKEQLKPAAKNFSIKKGAIRQIQTNLVENNPPTTKVSISLREDVPYQITKTNKQMMIIFDKTAKHPVSVQDVQTSTAVTVSESSSTFLSSQTVTVEGKEYELDENDETGENIIQPGSVFRKQIFPATILSEYIFTDSKGTARMALTGDLKVSHMTTAQLEDEIRKDLSQILPKQNIKITIQKCSPGQIFILGEVKLPGIYNLNESMTCSQLITKSGGFRENADKKTVILYRGQKKKMKKINIDIEKIFSSEDRSSDILLEPGDIVNVPRLSDTVLIMGSVQSPEWYPFKEGLKLTQAIALAGGLKKNAQTEQIRIIRNEQGKKLSQFVNVKEILASHPEQDPRLKAQDVIVVPEIAKSKSKILSWRGTSWIIFIASIGVVLALAL